MVLLRLAALLLSFSDLAPAPPTPFDLVVALQLDATDPLVANRGRAARVEYVAEFSGTLHVWTRAKDVDLILRIEEPDGTLIARDDNSGGATTPYLAIDVEPERELVIVVTAESAVVARTEHACELNLIAAPESAETRAAADEGRAALTRIARLRGTNQIAEARAVAEAAVSQLVLLSDGNVSERVGLALRDLGLVTYQLQLLAATEVAWRHAWRHVARTLPETHTNRLRVSGNLGATLSSLGQLEDARSLEEQLVAVYGRTRPADHIDLVMARRNLASTLKLLGDLPTAVALERQVLEVSLRTLPEDHPELQMSRNNLAATLWHLGDLAAARSLFEQVLRSRERTLSRDHPDVQSVRCNLAILLAELGDPSAARVLQEEVLACYERTLPEDHPDLRDVRFALAGTIKSLGQVARARELEEQIIATLSRTHAPDDPVFLPYLQNLAESLMLLGDLDGACHMREQVLAACETSLPTDHHDLMLAQRNLAVTLAFRTAVRGSSPRTDAGAPQEDVPAVQRRCLELMRSFGRGQLLAAKNILLTSSAREAEERCYRLTRTLGVHLSFASGFGVLAPMPELDRDGFVLSETTRAAALTSAALARWAARSPAYATLRQTLQTKSDQLASLTRSAAKSDDVSRALRQREDAERALLSEARRSPGAAAGLELDIDRLAARMSRGRALVAFRRYGNAQREPNDFLVELHGGPRRTPAIDSLCAFVLRHQQHDTTPANTAASASLQRVELGPIAVIQAAVHDWREALGATAGSRGATPVALNPTENLDERGVALRRLVWDPLLPAIQDADRIVVVLDDVLHLVPLDVLPLDAVTSAQPSLVGDRWRIETRVTSAELLVDAPAVAGGALVAIGGLSYGSPSRGSPVVASRASDGVAILRGTPWSAGFADLPATAEEVRQIAALHRAQLGPGELANLIEGAAATRDELFRIAPTARWLHVATHGWFAADVTRSSGDRHRLDDPGAGQNPDAVAGMSPMLLCGLALAGANQLADERGRTPGLVTADEIATLDLTSCELAALSACDTNVGVLRAGQGVASLQRALHMAGARSVITSLWKVPDEATRDLMLDFYRRLWVERQSKQQALWQAKMTARAGGRAMRDWAAWVLTGDPE